MVTIIHEGKRWLTTIILMEGAISDMRHTHNNVCKFVYDFHLNSCWHTYYATKVYTSNPWSICVMQGKYPFGTLYYMQGNGLICSIGKLPIKYHEVVVVRVQQPEDLLQAIKCNKPPTLDFVSTSSSIPHSSSPRSSPLSLQPHHNVR